MRIQLLAAILILAACGPVRPEPAEAAAAAAPVVAATAPPTASATADQTAGLAVLEPVIEKELGQPVTLTLTLWKTSSDYAYLTAETTAADGKAIDVAAAKGDEGEYDGALTEAFLRKVGGVWTVMDHVIGATDVWSLSQCGVVPADLVVCE